MKYRKSKYQVIPDLTDEEYEDLKEDIAVHGVMVPIEFDEYGNCLDGHHRLKACQELGITDYPKVIRAGMNEEEKDEHAILLNVSRRHLTVEQKIEVAKTLKRRHPEWPISKIAKMLHMDRGQLSVQLDDIDRLNTVESADGRIRPATAKAAAQKREAIKDEINKHPEKSDRQIARETGTSNATVSAQRKKMVSAYNPSKRDEEALKDKDIVNRLASDKKMTVAGAIREQKRDQLVEHLEDVEAKEAKAAKGIYDVVVVDPPWEMEKIEREERPNQVEFDYPTMSLDEIKTMNLPAADDCHVFLWTTQKYLPDAFEILKAWNVKYVCTFVWHKNVGYKPFGLPMYNSEFCLYGHVGNPKLVDEKNFKTCFNADVTGHSEKPEEFYEMLRRVTAGRRLDMFNRRKIDGFDGWGKDAVENDPKPTDSHGADANEFTFIDLFAGIGGIRLGFEAAGGRCVFSSEIDEEACKTYEANFGEHPSGDITKIDAKNIPDFDILLAGFPCQPFSVIGNQKGFDDKTNGNLFFEIERILKVKHPAAFMLENVKNLATHDGGKTLNIIKSHLEALGYHVHVKVLNSIDYGVPQLRERLIIVGFLDYVKFTFPEPVSDDKKRSLTDILEPNVDRSYFVEDAVKVSRLARTKDKDFVKPYISHENKSGLVTPHEYSCALRASASTNYLLVNDERRLTEREMLRLQGFPDTFSIVGDYGQIKKQCGNTVTVPIIAAVATQMVLALKH